MPYILDASIAAAWVLADEASPLAKTAAELLKSDGAIVPSLWWYEIRNTLVMAERTGRIAPKETAHFLDLMRAYPIRIETNLDEQAIFRLAKQFGLSFYDAAYLSIAHRDGLVLATLDRELASAARKLGVILLD